MKIGIMLRRAMLLVIAGVFISSGLIIDTYAEDTKKETVWAQSGGKTVIDDIKPGEKYENTIQLWNDSSKPSISTFTVKHYGVDANGGYGYVNEHETRATMHDWLTYANGTHDIEYIMQPNETIEVPYKIQVPSDWTISGSQTTAIVISSREYDVKRETQEGINIETEYVHVVYANIDGDEDLEYKGRILEWRVPFIVFDNNDGLGASTIIENIGNATFSANITTEIYDKSNGKLVYSKNSEPYIFPDSSKETTQTWREAPAIGLFDVRGEVTVNGQTEKFEKTVLIIPLWFVIIIVAIVLLLLWALVLKIRQHRNKTKRLKS